MKHSIEQIMDLVLAVATDSKKTYGSADEYARTLETQVRFYKMGMNKEFPQEWKEFIPTPTEAEKKMAAHPLQFEYCECGCHCHSAQSKGIGYSLYDSLQKEKYPFRLCRGHGLYGPEVGKYATFDEAVIAAQADYDKIP